MRQSTVGGKRVYYPDEISFAFNPEYVIIDSDVEAEITLSANGKTFTDKREAIGGEMKMDISYYLQMLFDIKRYKYSNTTSIEINVTVAFSGNTFNFSTVCIWGSIAPGEVINPSGKEIWYKKALTSQIIQFFNPVGNTVVYGSYDGGEVKQVMTLNGKGGIVSIIPALYFPKAEKEIILYIGGLENIDTFDETFDETFHPTDDKSTSVLKIEINNCDEEDRMFLDWIDNRGLRHFHLFQQSNLSIQMEDDGDSIHIDFDDVSLIPKSGERHYNGVSRQMKTEQKTLSLNSPLVDKETYRLLSTILASPLINANLGQEGTFWTPVNVVAGTKTMLNSHLQDFELTILLPETQIQRL